MVFISSVTYCSCSFGESIIKKLCLFVLSIMTDSSSTGDDDSKLSLSFFNGITIFADSSLYFLSIRLDLIISFALSGMGRNYQI
jgi:hypothetical protein